MNQAAHRHWRVLTVPNAISAARLGAVPWFAWLQLSADSYLPAGVLLAVLGATDWVDGYIARRFDQSSELGKILDPFADRVLLIAAATVLVVDSEIPTWVGVAVLGREAVVSIAALLLAVAGARRIDVEWAGKAGTLAIMFALPGFQLANHADGAIHAVLLTLAWIFTVGGLVLSYTAAVRYVPLARSALRAGRSDREAVGDATTLEANSPDPTIGKEPK